MLSSIVICLATINVVFSTFTNIDLLGFTTGSVGYELTRPAGTATTQPIEDFNGDGIEDMFIGMTTNRAYIVFGRVGNVASAIDMSTFVSSASTGIVLLGDTGDGFGQNAHSAGDFNGDGNYDIIVGASGASSLGRTGSGKAYLIFGRSNAQGVNDISMSTLIAGSSGFTIFGSSFNAYCGQRVTGAGDMNGDGFDEAVVGCSNSKSYVIFGKASGFSDIDLNGLSSDSRGFSISVYTGMLNPAGDFNHDGYDDLFIGADVLSYLDRSNAGRGRIVFGHSTATAFPALADADIISGTVGFTIYGGAASDQCGFNGGYVGDINGDGVDDIAISCPQKIVLSRSYAGIVFVLFGNSVTASYPALDLASFATSASVGFRILAAAYTDYLGRGLNSAGDVNGDGIGDLIIGAPRADPLGRLEAGTAYVVYGRHHATSTFADMDLFSFPTGPTTGFQILGSPAGAENFIYVSSAGDVNGDGTDDLLMSSVQGARVIVIYGMGVPTAIPTRAPSQLPTVAPTWQPSITPTQAPSAVPTVTPTADPSKQPTPQPSSQPSSQPTTQPSSQPSKRPSFQPSSQPSTQPISDPSSQPSAQPSCQPTTAPSSQPSLQPSAQPSCMPSSQPSDQPSSQPSTKPSSLPSCQPSTQPSTQPTSQPTMDLRFITKVRASPTYRVCNGFAFAVTSVNGTVHTWGEAPHGGDSSAVSAHLAANVTKILPSLFAYAALKDDGSVVPWGAADAVHGLDAYPPGSFALSELIANEAAFAGIDAGTGRVIAFGSRHTGGNVLSDATWNGYTQQLTANIIALAASAGAFAALSSDGSVYAWGNKHAGGGVSREFLVSLPPIQLVVATRSSFAALSLSGRVFAWGDALSGGDTSSVSALLASGVVHIIAAKSVFMAFKNDTSLVVWGYGETGGDASAVAAELSANVTFVAHTFLAIAALKTDGTVVTWGSAAEGGDSSVVQAQLQDVEWIYGNSKAFAALTAAGRVVAWGKSAFGGQIPSNKVSALSSGVISIYHTDRAFAALKDDGSVVVWGQAGHGGSPGAVVEAHLVSGVHTICSNDVAFSVIKTDGSVVGWGHPVSIPTAGVLFNSNEMTVRAECF